MMMPRPPLLHSANAHGSSQALQPLPTRTNLRCTRSRTSAACHSSSALPPPWRRLLGRAAWGQRMPTLNPVHLGSAH